MKKIYSVECRVMNGTAMIHNSIYNFTDKNIAEDSIIAIQEKNKDNAGLLGLSIITNLSETELYENREEVPILNQEQHDR